MNSIPWRAQLTFIALGYAAVFVVAACFLYLNHLAALRNPIEASGGMYAGGELVLEIFLSFLFLIPTLFLIWATAKFEVFYTAYSKFLLGLSLSAPVCLSVVIFGENHVARSLGFFCLFRLVWSPFILVGMGISRIVARFDRAKRFASYALLIEMLTLVTAVALLIHG